MTENSPPKTFAQSSLPADAPSVNGAPPTAANENANAIANENDAAIANGAQAVPLSLAAAGEAVAVDTRPDAEQRRLPPIVPGAAGGYSRFVDAMKLVLPGLAVIVFLAVIVVTSLRREDDSFAVDIPTDLDAEESEQMAKPEMTGFDDKGRPYNVTAHKATKDVENASIIHLEDVSGWMLIERQEGGSVIEADMYNPGSLNNEARPEDQLKITSKEGVLYSEDELIDLSGDVVMTIGTTYRIKTDAATIDMKDRSARGEKKTSVTLDWGQIDAEGFEAQSDTRTVIFRNNVRTTLYPNATPGDKSTGTAAPPPAQPAGTAQDAG